ncbi:MAG: glutamate-5-semialdehyde dehydrogenase [Bacteroidales bacterium]
MDNSNELIKKGKLAKQTSYFLARMSSDEKKVALSHVAGLIVERSGSILAANEKDLLEAKNNNVKDSLVDRLRLTVERIGTMAEGLSQIALLDDPVGEVLSMKTRPNGLQIGQIRVPIGVIGIIYESRPNVTVDAFGLCLKTGNAVILRGGKEAINSNMAIVKVIQEALISNGIPPEAIQLVENTSRESAVEMMKLNDYLDILIPRGGAGLIKTVVENSRVPVIETGVGNCHVYVDESANTDMAANIVINAKTQRPGVCNAIESLLIHSSVADRFLPVICDRLKDHGVEIRGDKHVLEIIGYAVPAVEDDWYAEYLDKIISVKVVHSLSDAIIHINKYGSKHSESIVTESYTNSQRFLAEIDAAAVYVNASTRFTDGFEFGFGAEIGISTQKLHARGPMGLKELTTTKYIIYGNGQIR